MLATKSAVVMAFAVLSFAAPAANAAGSLPAFCDSAPSQLSAHELESCMRWEAEDDLARARGGVAPANNTAPTPFVRRRGDPAESSTCPAPHYHMTAMDGCQPR